MAFQILRRVPHYNDRDGIEGWTTYRMPYAYLICGCATAIAARMSGEDDTVDVKVVPYGDNWESSRGVCQWPAPADLWPSF